jgi:hypothetical protein
LKLEPPARRGKFPSHGRTPTVKGGRFGLITATPQMYVPGYFAGQCVEVGPLPCTEVETQTPDRQPPCERLFHKVQRPHLGPYRLMRLFRPSRGILDEKRWRSPQPLWVATSIKRTWLWAARPGWFSRALSFNLKRRCPGRCSAAHKVVRRGRAPRSRRECRPEAYRASSPAWSHG